MHNGHDDGPLAGWAIVQAHGLTLIGKLEAAGTYGALEPVYKLEVKLIPNEGRLVVLYACFPLFMLASLRRAPITDGALVWPVEDRDRAERVELLKAVQQCEEAIQEVRASRAGVRLALPNEKLPPPPGGKS